VCGVAGCPALSPLLTLINQSLQDWLSYYNQNGSNKFPVGPVAGWNTNDHGVNNAEGTYGTLSAPPAASV